MTTVAHDKLFDVPGEVAVCPYCGGKLFTQCNAWQESKDGWIAESLDVDCETEPDIDGTKWEDWFAAHSEMPYIYMLPVTIRVEKWVNENFRFSGLGE